jgi:hypothetical protein
MPGGHWQQLHANAPATEACIHGDVREYLMSHYLVLYAHVGSAVYLLSIRHQRQTSFDFPALWNT